MKKWQALVEWESGGLDDIATEMLKELRDELDAEIEHREREETTA